jgi:hypothetical protein
MFSFKTRKDQEDLKQFVLRFINQNTAGRSVVCENRRYESRVNLSLGVRVVPLRDGSPDVDAAFSAVTKDLSTAGIAIMTDRTSLPEEVLLQLPSEPSPRFIRAQVNSCAELGCGWMAYILVAAELLDEDAYSDIL